MHVLNSIKQGSKFYLYFIWASYFLLTFFSCKDEIIVGSGLLDDEIVMVDVTDQIGLQSKTEFSDPFITFDSISLDRRTVFVGSVSDAVFGTITPELAISFNLNTSNPPAYPIGEKPLFADSLVLVLTFDTLASYGDLSTPFRVLVSSLNDRIPSGRFIKSDIVLSKGIILADTMLYMRPKDSVSIINHTDGKNIKQLPQLRIRFPKQLATQLLEDKPASTRDSAFVEFLKGVHISAVSMNGKGIAGFNLSTQALSSSVSNKLVMYYTESDTLKKAYNYTINRRFVNMSRTDYAGSVVEQHVQDSLLADKISFVQGFGGPKVKILLKDLTAVKDKVINFAQLEVTAESSTGDAGLYKAADQLFALKKNANGEFELIDDILPNVSFSNAIAVFGGQKVSSSGRVTYTMNITNQLKAFIKNPFLERAVYLTLPNISENVQRSMIYGANHEQFKMKLKINFTTN